MTTIAALRDTLALALFGIDVATALHRRACIRCRQPVDVARLPDPDAREYRLTALCPPCWSVLTRDDGPVGRPDDPPSPRPAAVAPAQPPGGHGVIERVELTHPLGPSRAHTHEDIHP